ncbi:Protein-lysine N-methyltransferase rrg1 [Recurvomyces mirabilis]|nr:Protein-lysine N-methyltransferase rrg1 [Recurvomyces mirabilis]
MAPCNGFLTARDLGLHADDEEVLDVLDLPQLHTRPTTKTLLSTLDDLSSQPPSWEATPRNGTPRTRSGASTPARKKRKVRSEGVPAYLTRIVANPLVWIENDEEKERIWETAARRLAERSGRTAMGDLTRVLEIPLGRSACKEGESGKGVLALKDGLAHRDEDDEMEYLDLTLHEPALTADNLGLKTWASSYLLAKRLHALRDTTLRPLAASAEILELGAGTGLVGMAAAAVFQRTVYLTDLPEIVPNLERNIRANEETIRACSDGEEKVATGVLDWSDPAEFCPGTEADHQGPKHSFSLILVADPIYSPDHPGLLVNAIEYHLSRDMAARVVVEMPVREAYASERRDFLDRMLGLGLVVCEEGEEVGYDDWGGSAGEIVNGEEGALGAEVRCWWSVWGWKTA